MTTPPAAVIAVGLASALILLVMVVPSILRVRAACREEREFPKFDGDGRVR